MQFTFRHTNFNVLDLQRSMEFYKEALGLTEVRVLQRSPGPYGSASYRNARFYNRLSRRRRF